MKPKKPSKKKYKVEITLRNIWGDIIEGYIDENGKIILKSKWV